jgi:diadenosine tetraphosphatase ApaH/serine/threonine PP2A family protein phosphatase
MRRTIVIGDIHGCYDELERLLKRLELQTDDRVVAVGDLTVKGPKSVEVIDLFAGDARFSSVVGNHDRALVRYWQGDGSPLKPAQLETLDELTKAGDHYLPYLASLPLFMDLGSYAVVHAGLRPGIPLVEQSAEDLTELRTLGADRTSREGVPWYDVYANVQVILFGHWPAQEPRRGRFAIGLDTGCVYGYHLTAYVIETKQFLRVKANRAYDKSDTTSTAPASNQYSHSPPSRFVTE